MLMCSIVVVAVCGSLHATDQQNLDPGADLDVFLRFPETIQMSFLEIFNTLIEQSHSHV